MEELSAQLLQAQAYDLCIELRSLANQLDAESFHQIAKDKLRIMPLLLDRDKCTDMRSAIMAILEYHQQIDIALIYYALKEQLGFKESLQLQGTNVESTELNAQQLLQISNDHGGQLPMPNAFYVIQQLVQEGKLTTLGTAIRLRKG